MAVENCRDDCTRIRCDDAETDVACSKRLDALDGGGQQSRGSDPLFLEPRNERGRLTLHSGEA